MRYRAAGALARASARLDLLADHSLFRITASTVVGPRAAIAVIQNRQGSQ